VVGVAGAVAGAALETETPRRACAGWSARGRGRGPGPAASTTRSSPSASS
jgi:hypothetical protein